jgi:SNF2 family DNA or RNA helicase
VQAGPWLAQTLRTLRSPGGATVEPGEGLQTQLRPYQREGVQWLWFLTQLELGACLADDMGLGKTVQVLALLLLLEQRQKKKSAPHLLIVPASLIANWKLEARRFAPSLRVLVAHSSELDGKALAAAEPAGLSAAQVVITSYGTLHRVPWLSARRWGLVVLDEAQAIKNPAAKQTRAVKALKSAARIALTGTPVENRLGDLWSLFDFLNPGLLGTARQFGDFVKQANAFGPLRELTGPYLLRRMKTDRSVIADLPEKSELKAWCGLSKRQAALYQQSVEGLAKELGQVDGIERRGLVLSYLMRFKQLCNHPSQWLGDGDYAAADSGKHARLEELGEVIASRQEKVLVFTQFKEMTQPLSRWLARIFGRPGLVLSGDTAVKRRQELVAAFQEDERVPFFVLSLKAGGTGLNLTAASHVIHFDRWWNPAVENQATDRAFRIGQKRNVLVHKFVCRGTIEERIDDLIDSKRNMAREVLEGGGELKLTELDDAALLKMVALDLRSARREEG